MFLLRWSTSCRDPNLVLNVPRHCKAEGQEGPRPCHQLGSYLTPREPRKALSPDLNPREGAGYGEVFSRHLVDLWPDFWQASPYTLKQLEHPLRHLRAPLSAAPSLSSHRR